MLKPEIIRSLSPERRSGILSRSMEDVSSVYQDMYAIVRDIAQRGDIVNVEHYRKHREDLKPEDFKVSTKDTENAYKNLDPKVVAALRTAAANIERFHRAQLEREMWTFEVNPGIIAGRMTRPLDIVGAYVPGGTAAYPSSVLMNIIPARVAGVKRVIACTPPGKGLTINDATIVAADLAGADALYRLGGPWAVGSMAYGTATVPKVDKIVGPGNKYVTAAKMAVFGTVDIDSPAGPSEGLILADDSPDPEIVAIDFLTQVEHDPDAASVLVTTSEKLATEVCRILAGKMEGLPRKEIIESALKNNSAVLIAADMEEAIDFTNEYATEHLQILTEDPWHTLPRIRHAGSIFMGPYAPIPVGDYASGTNHVLPTGQCAKMFSGLSVDDFIKKPTFQYLSRQGLESLKETVITLAEHEGLSIHAEAVRARFRK
jgi:histidinol dehydrogenase